MAVKKTTDILVRHEPRQAPPYGKGDLTPALPQLGRDEGKPEGRVTVLLLGAFHEVVSAIEATLVEVQAPAFRNRAQLVEVPIRAGGEHERDTPLRPVRQPDARAVGDPENFDAGSGRRFRDERQIGDEFAAAPDVAGRHDAGGFGMRPPQVRFQSGKILGGVMDEPLPVRTSHQRNALKHLGLESCPEPCGRLQPVVPAGGLEVRDAGDPKLAVEIERVRRAQAGNGEKRKNVRWHLGPHGLEPRRRPVPVELPNGLGEGDADAGEFAQTVGHDDGLERLAQQRQALGRTRIGPRLVRVLSREHEPPADLHKESGYCPCIEALRGLRRTLRQ
jgi:hypothetical protein